MKFNRRQRFAVYGGLFMSTAAFMALVNGGSVGALTSSPTTGAAAAATSSTAATATTASTASTTSTTEGPTTTTTVGSQQATVSGKLSDNNKCHTELVPPVQAASDGTTPISISATAFPQPHKGQPIKLTNTSLTITTKGSTFQAGVPALFGEGSKVPSAITLVVSGSGTTEGTHTYKFNATVTLHLVNNVVQDITATTPLPDTTWHPKNATDPVIFSEQSLTLVASIDASKLSLGTIKGTSACTAAGAGRVVAVSAQGGSVPTTPTTASTRVTAAAATTTTTVAAAANTLPRTGANGIYLIIIGAALLDAGAALLLMTRRRHA